MIFVLSPKAQEDLKAVLEWIATENPNAAQRVREAILYTCGLIAENPWIGRDLEGLSLVGVRRFSVNSFDRYTIFYRVNAPEKEIEIIRLGADALNWKKIGADPDNA